MKPRRMTDFTVDDLFEMVDATSNPGVTNIVCPGVTGHEKRQMFAGPFGKVIAEVNGDEIAQFDNRELNDYLWEIYDMRRNAFYDFIQRLQSWSEKTFGPMERRGPKGPILHLKKEVDEVLAEIDNNEPIKLAEELIDCMFLIQDAWWRCGFNYTFMIQMLEMKLEKNWNREWPDWKQADPEKPIEHKRGEE